MSDIDKQIDEILKECVEICADCITCFDTDEYIEISDKRWLGKGPNGYYRNQIKALISTAVREAEGCVDCKKRRCENCERLWAT